MTHSGMFAVGARLLGIYFVIDGLAALPMLGSIYNIPLELQTSRALLYVIGVLQILIMVAAGLALIYRYRSAMLQDGEKFPATDQPFTAGLQLLGIFFALSGAVHLAASIAMNIASHSSDFDNAGSGINWIAQLRHFAPHAFQMIAGLIVLRWAIQIVALLSRQTSASRVDAKDRRASAMEATDQANPISRPDQVE
jgi:hypothetical protein